MSANVEKKARLTEAAAKLIHQNGFSQTTLADIAAAAQVALGSVYYYFKSKDEVAQAILDRRSGDLARLLKEAEQLPDPRARLDVLIQIWVDDREIDAWHGCPIGSLCYELAKGRGPLSDASAQPIKLMVSWCTEQFRQLGHVEQASVLAHHLVSCLQGISLLANAFVDPDLILAETVYLAGWLDTLQKT
ncbi:MAG TPA: TetR/AcrR family transcriptional regulator [Thiobacillus sp.]